MDLRKAVANWYACDYGRLRCLGEKQCLNYVWVDPRTWSKTGVGPGTTGKRSCVVC